MARKKNIQPVPARVRARRNEIERARMNMQNEQSVEAGRRVNDRFLPRDVLQQSANQNQLVYLVGALLVFWGLMR